MISKEKIVSLIIEDQYSRKKRFARKAQAYYDARHDIKDYRIFWFNKDGKLVEDLTRSNIRISHPFFTELVDQEVQYLLANGIQIDTEEAELKGILENDYFNEDFLVEFKEMVTGAIIKGFDYMYLYKDTKFITKFEYVDGLGIIEAKTDGPLDTVANYVIYYYPAPGKDDRPITKVEVWTQTDTTYYVYGNGRGIELDPEVEINPRPHILYELDGEYYTEEMGYLPIFRLDHNRKQSSGLRPIKDIIDDYDLMDCGLSNNLQDINEGIYVVKGFKGTDLDELMYNIKSKKVVGVGEKGDLDIRTINIPYEARKVKMEVDKENIYQFGMGFNASQIGDGNITNVVILSRYALLDLKCNKLEPRLKKFLKQLLRIVIPEINARYQRAYRPEDVKLSFEREVITSAESTSAVKKTEAEIQQLRINTILYAAAKLDDETIIGLICEELDLDYDEIKDRIPTAPPELDKVSEVLADEPVSEGGGETAPAA